MQRVDDANWLQQVPADLFYYYLINNLSGTELGPLRQLSTTFRNKIDTLLTRPLMVLTIMAQLKYDLNDPASCLFNFVQFYTRTRQYLDLTLQKPEKISVIERFCLDRVQAVVMADPRQRSAYFREKGREFSDHDILELFTALPTPVIVTFLGSKSGEYPYRYFPVFAGSKHYANPMDCLAILVNTIITTNIYSLSITRIDPMVMTLENHPTTAQDEVVMKCLQSVKVTRAALNPLKTEEDWRILRAGAPAYINLSCLNLASNANLQCANLSGANLQSAYLCDANLERANLSQAHLVYAHLDRARLDHANLQEVDARHADFRSASLKYANFQRGDLRDATMNHAALENANYNHACMRDIKWLDNWGISHQQMRQPSILGAVLTHTQWFDFDKIRRGHLFFSDTNFISTLPACEGFTHPMVLLLALAENYIRLLRQLPDKRLAITMLEETIQSSFFLLVSKINDDAKRLLEREKEQLISVSREGSLRLGGV